MSLLSAGNKIKIRAEGWNKVMLLFPFLDLFMIKISQKMSQFMGKQN